MDFDEDEFLTSLEVKLEFLSKLNEDMFQNSDEIDPWRIAQAFNVDSSTIEKWLSQGMPRQANGTFCMDKVIEWLVENEIDPSGGVAKYKEAALRQRQRI